MSLPVSTRSARRIAVRGRLRRALLSAAGVLVMASMGIGGPASAQDAPRIILQTDPDPIEIPLQDSSSVIINPLSGDITATPADPAACSGSGGDCDAQVDVISLTTPSEVFQGQSFTATFNQRGAWECARSGLPGTDWDSDFVAPGSQQVNVLVTSQVAPADYVLRLTCRNGTTGGDAEDFVERMLTVREAGGSTPQECIDQGRLPPSTWSQELNADASETDLNTPSWVSVFGQEFPFGDAFNMRIRPMRYAAFEFPTGTQRSSGNVDFSDLGGQIIGVGTRPAIVSFSACPGDFVPQSGDQSRCRLSSVGGVNPGFQWTRLSGEAITKCLIPSNETYYLNITYVTSASQDASNPEDLVWDCEGQDQPCGHRLQVTSNP